MLKKLLTSLTVISLLIVGVGNFSNAYDYQELNKQQQESVKQNNDIYYSLGVATSSNDIEIYKHCEDGANLKESYNINIHNGHLEKGKKYKIKYFGDYIADIKKL